MLCAGLALTLNACVVVPAPIESHYNRGVQLYDEQKYTDAIAEYQLALKDDPENYFAQYNLAVAYQDAGKPEAALEQYRNILAKGEDANSRINIAGILYARGDVDGAFKELETAADSNPHNPNPLGIWGDYLTRENKLKEAEEKFKAALQREPNHAWNWNRLGLLHARNANHDDAYAALLKSVELDPQEPAFLESLALEYERRDELMEAINLLEAASALQPDRKDMYIRLGDLYKKTQMYQEALTRYWTALSINDDEPQVHRSLLEIYQRLAENEKQQVEQIERQGTLAQKNP